MFFPGALILSLCLSTAAFGGSLTNGSALDYRLSVSFDLQASEIHGQATLRVTKGQELKLRTGTLHLLDLDLNQEKLAIPAFGETLTIRPAEDGLIKIRYRNLSGSGDFFLIVKENPWNSRETVAILQSRSAEETEAAFPKIFHYEKYSAVGFERGRNIYRETEAADRGIVQEVAKEAIGVRVSSTLPLSEVIKEVADKKIIYVGENHDRFSHHLTQLEIVKGLQERGKKVAIGMEMFQRPFQKALDDFISGRIDEREFLSKSEYFKRWGFDFRLYRPILQFARSRRIPVVALNLEQEIVKKVAKGGLDSLSEAEKKLVPRQMDFSDRAYQEKLKQIFKAHESLAEKNFHFFWEAQILWDETMAESIDLFLQKNPEFQMVVLAGNGHLTFGSGIPNRAARRNGFPNAVLLNDTEVEPGVGTYVLFPGTAPFAGPARLMVILGEDQGKVKVEGFSENSSAKASGLQVGDLILEMDGTAVHRLEDLKILLLYREKNERVKIKIRRAQPPGEDQEMEFAVELK